MEKFTAKKILTNLPIFLLTTLLFTTSPSLHAEVQYSTPLHGKEFKMGNRIEWKTAYELETKLFIVEKSDDGMNFYSEREVEAAGNSDQEKGYRFMDIGNNDPTTFYRLKLVDEDGAESYSEIVIVKKTMSNNFQIVRMSKTTVIKNFEISLDALAEKEMTYSVETFDGKTVFTTTQNLDYGLNEIEINLQDEPIGKYRLVFKVEDESEVIVIRKVEGEETQKENVAVKKRTTKKG